MGIYGVLERDEGIGEILADRFGPPCRPEEAPQLLVIAPAGAKALGERTWSCETVLLPGDGAIPLERLQARSAVSYGLSPKNTITLSSREGDRFCAALQRELVTVDGRVLERQELVFRANPHRDALRLLLLAGAFLLLGAEPEAQ